VLTYNKFTGQETVELPADRILKFYVNSKFLDRPQGTVQVFAHTLYGQSVVRVINSSKIIKLSADY